ncbi:MAG: hypothetical protein ACREYF_01505 [Gammaproteobacteria bacterium]
MLNYETVEQAQRVFQALARRHAHHAAAAHLLGQDLGHARRQVRHAVDRQWRKEYGFALARHVDVGDIAAVAVRALTEPDHEGRAYTLTGPQALTYHEFADELSKLLGRSISHINLSPLDLKNGMLAEEMPEAIADRMLDLERYFREGRASRIARDIKQVTGREPRRFADTFAREVGSSPSTPSGSQP